MKKSKSNFFTKPFFQKIVKPWGYEIILVPPDSPVTGKTLHLNKGCRFSLQYHEKKQETLVLIKGQAWIILGENQRKLKKVKMEQFRGYFIRVGLIHRCQAITSCDIFEASTKEKGETVRLEDDYSRGMETEEIRKKRGKRGVYMG